ncbi:hypothetical protein BaRGS_00017298 [Batillaria attramentaria]|uniref:Uncharacterized protein n=1 Tax=Batillaria attramentaria TaxID=370345 RepID=A0ABD0KX38_9CAEN
MMQPETGRGVIGTAWFANPQNKCGFQTDPANTRTISRVTSVVSSKLCSKCLRSSAVGRTLDDARQPSYLSVLAMKINPVSVAAFVLTVVAVVFVLVGFALPRWYQLETAGNRKTWYGLWWSEECDDSECKTDSTTELKGGQEFFFISKVFESLAVLLVLVGLVLHVVYVPLRIPLVRQSAIYMLGAAGLFLLLATLIFVALYDNLHGPSETIHLGPSFPISIVGGLLCIAASIVTAWASVRKANLSDDDAAPLEIAPAEIQ